MAVSSNLLLIVILSLSRPGTSLTINYGTTSTSVPLSFQASAFMVQQHLESIEDDTFCLVVHNNLTSTEIIYLTDKLRKGSLLEASGLNDKSRRIVSPCSIVIGRDFTEANLKELNVLLPLAKYFLLVKDVKVNDKSLPATYIHASPKDFDEESYKIVTLDCRGRVTKSAWKKEARLAIRFVRPSTLDQDCFRGKTFGMSGFGLLPYINHNVMPFTGIDVDILNILKEKLGFSVNYVLGNGWGTIVNGSWTGLVGNVYRGVTEMGMGDVAISSARMQVVDYTHYTYSLHTKFFTRTPDSQDQFFKIFLPLSFGSWMSFLVSTVLVSLTALLVIRFNPLIMSNPQLSSTSVWKIIYGLFFMLVQPFSLGHKSWITIAKSESSGAFGLSVWFVAGAFFNFFYTSTLRASLMAVTYPKPLNSIEDALNANVPIWMIGGSSVVSLLAVSPKEEYRRAWELALTHDRFYTLSGGMPDHVIQEILTENAAVLSTPVTVNKIAHDFYEEHGYQPFHLMKEVVFDNRAGILISKEHYRLKDKLDPIIMRMVESRIIDKIEADYRPETYDEHISNDPVMDLWHFSSTFFFYFILIGVSTAVFLMEYFHLTIENSASSSNDQVKILTPTIKVNGKTRKLSAMELNVFT